MTRLIVVRHGETDYNRARRYQGSVDVPLNDAGREQAKSLVSTLQAYPLDAIVTSPLQRARQTAEPLAQVRGLAVHTMPAFAERHLGEFEGCTREELEEAYPELWARDVNRQMYAAPPGGESLFELSARVANGLRGVRSRWPALNVVLVSHAAVARAINGLLGRLFDDEVFGSLLRNGEVAEYRL